MNRGSLGIRELNVRLKAELNARKPDELFVEKLDRLHRVIQTAMGWTDSHLHQFVVDGVYYGLTANGTPKTPRC